MCSAAPGDTQARACVAVHAASSSTATLRRHSSTPRRLLGAPPAYGPGCAVRLGSNGGGVVAEPGAALDQVLRCAMSAGRAMLEISVNAPGEVACGRAWEGRTASATRLFFSEAQAQAMQISSTGHNAITERAMEPRGAPDAEHAPPASLAALKQLAAAAWGARRFDGACGAAMHVLPCQGTSSHILCACADALQLYTHAYQLAASAAPTHATAGSPSEAALMASNLAAVLLRLDQPQKALELAQQASQVRARQARTDDRPEPHPCQLLTRRPTCFLAAAGTRMAQAVASHGGSSHGHAAARPGSSSIGAACSTAAARHARC